MVRMKHMKYFLIPLLFPTVALAQECESGRYATEQFTDIGVTYAIPFGSNSNLAGGEQTLYMDVFEPLGDPLEQRPVVLVAFGGSFVAGSRADVAPICQAFARRGFVAIAPDYRIGFFLPNTNSTSQAVLRGAHDMKACVRYLRRSVEEMENPYRIDTERILIGGISAGAISALHAGFLDLPEEWPTALSAQYDALGGIEGNSGNSGYSSAVKAIFSFSGALGDTLWIGDGDLPVCSVHEVGDAVVPYYTEEVAVFSIPTGLVASGSHDIHARLDHQGVPNCLLTYPGTGHVGYLDYEPLNSVAFVLDFCAAQVCDQELGCGNVTASVSDQMNLDTFSVFPNPTEGSMMIRVTKQTWITVSDPTGRVLLRERTATGVANMDLSTFAAGTYLIHDDDGAGQFIIKVDPR